MSAVTNMSWGEYAFQYRFCLFLENKVNLNRRKIAGKRSTYCILRCLRGGETKSHEPETVNDTFAKIKKNVNKKTL